MSSPLGKLARLARLATVLLAAFPLALLLVCLNPGGGVSQADPLSSCTTTTGVIVIVDFSHWGGNADRICFAALTTTTAYDALIAEGFTTIGDAHDGSAFVCRITEPGTGVAEPSVSEDPCTTTPPATAYWSFWIANAGQGAWSVSPLGVMSLVPQPGSVEYWNFGSDVGEADRPPLSPSAVRASNTTPTTEPSTPPPIGVSPSGGSGTAGSSGTGATTPMTPPGNGKSARAPTAAGGHGAKAAPATSTNSSKGSTTTPSSSARGHSSGGTPSGRAKSSLKVVDIGPTSAVTSRSSGSPLPLVFGGILVAALAVGAIMVVRRRRRLD
jgi:hypothetical protein